MRNEQDSEQSVLESLSAMFDGEANEQDLHDLLEQDSAELNKRMEAFHLIQNTLRKDTEVDVQTSFSLADRVRQQLAYEREKAPSQQVVALFPSEEKEPKKKRDRSLWTGFALAASVAFLVVLGGNVILNPAHNTVPVSVAKIDNNDVSKLPVMSLAELKKQPLDVDSLRLQNYLRQHAEQATMTVGQGMIPMARIASFPVEK